jgi:hypothetical protein
MDQPAAGEVPRIHEDIKLPSEFADSGANGVGDFVKLAADETTPPEMPLKSPPVAGPTTLEPAAGTEIIELAQVPPKIAEAKTLTVDMRQLWTLKEYPSIPLSILIMIVGSRGDVQPFVALGRMLKEKYGHRWG